MGNSPTPGQVDQTNDTGNFGPNDNFDNDEGFEGGDDFNDDNGNDFNEEEKQVQKEEKEIKEERKWTGSTLKISETPNSPTRAKSSYAPVIDNDGFLSPSAPSPVDKIISATISAQETPKKSIITNPWVHNTHACETQASSPWYCSNFCDSSYTTSVDSTFEGSDAQMYPNQHRSTITQRSTAKLIKRSPQSREAAHSLENTSSWLSKNFTVNQNLEKLVTESDLNNSTDQVPICSSKVTMRFHHNDYGYTRKKNSMEIDGKTVWMYGRRYVIGEHIGEGSYAKVIEAYDTMARKVVAIKVNKVPLIKSSMSKELRVLDELTRGRSNDNVVSLMDHWLREDKIKQFIVLTYTPCGTLKKLLEQVPDHVLPLPQARCMFRCLINGLAYIHSKGVFHRDIKADNLLLINERSLFITDFGTATKKIQSKGGGAPGYQPPELAKTGHAPSTAKQDIWAAGITLYIMVIGHFPFELGPLAKIYEEISRCEFDFHEDSLPADLVTLLKGTLHPDPNLRMTLEEIMDSAWMKSNEGENDGSVDFVIPKRIPTAFNEDFVSKILIAPTTY